MNRAVADGSFARNEALVSAFERARERGGDVHLLGLVSYGGVHSHVDAPARAARARATPREWPSERGCTRSRTGATCRRRPPCAISPSCPPSGSRRCAAATTPWTETSAGSGRTALRPRSVAGKACERTIPIAAVRASYERGVTDEFVEPVVLDGRPRLGREGHGDLLQLPAGSSAPALAAASRGRDRPDDDDALPRRLPVPGRVRRAGGARTRSPRCSPRTGSASSTSPRRRSTRTSRTSSTAARSGSGRARRGSSSPSPRDVPSYDLKPEMSAARGRPARLRRDRRRLRVLRRQLREPGHGRPHGLDPRGRRGGRGDRPGARSRRRRARRRPAASVWSPPTTGMPR